MTPVENHLAARGWTRLGRDTWKDPETGATYPAMTAHYIALNRGMSRFRGLVSEVLSVAGHDAGSTVGHIAYDMADDVGSTVERVEYFAAYYRMSPRHVSAVDAALNMVILAEQEAARGVRRIRQ